MEDSKKPSRALSPVRPASPPARAVSPPPWAVSPPPRAISPPLADVPTKPPAITRGAAVAKVAASFGALESSAKPPALPRATTGTPVGGGTNDSVTKPPAVPRATTVTPAVVALPKPAPLAHQRSEAGLVKPKVAVKDDPYSIFADVSESQPAKAVEKPTVTTTASPIPPILSKAPSTPASTPVSPPLKPIAPPKTITTATTTNLTTSTIATTLIEQTSPTAPSKPPKAPRGQISSTDFTSAAGAVSTVSDISKSVGVAREELVKQEESDTSTSGSSQSSNSPDMLPPRKMHHSRDQSCFSEDDDDTLAGEFNEDLIDLEIAPNPIPKHIRLGMEACELLKQGWLSKSSHKGQISSKTFMGRNLDLWKKRWIVLRSDGISYYANEDISEDKKLGFVPLHTIFDLAFEDDVISVASSIGRTLRLKAAKPELTAEWAASLEDLRDSKVQSKNTRKTEEVRALQLAELMEQQVRESKRAPKLYRQGWLHKQGGSQKSTKAMIGFGKTSWKKRWVVLNSYGLSYYDSEEAFLAGAVELSFIPFDHNFAFTEVAKTNPEESQFALVSNSRTMAFRAETKEEKWEWMQSMMTAKESFVQVRPAAADQVQESFGVVDLKPQQQAIEDKLMNRNSIREGYLIMQKEGVKKTWKSRYFVLLPGELTFYKHPKDLSALGSFTLDVHSVVQTSKDQAFTFFVVPSPNAKQILLSAESGQSQINWLDAFRHSVPNMFVSKGVASGINASAGRSLLQVTRKSTRSLKEGFMLKQGHLNKTWKRRYFVLESGSLEYYKNPQDKYCRGSIALGNQGDILTADTDVRCTLLCGSKTTNLSCESPLELLAWLTAFQSIKQLTVITNTGGKKQLRKAKAEPEPLPKS